MANARLEKQVGDVNWNYLEYGEGRPIFVFHGLNNNAGLISKVLVALAQKGFNVIAPDLPGFGFTKALEKNTYMNVADELTKFIHSFGFEQIDIYGHSLGGTLALRVGELNYDITNTVFTSSPYWRKGGLNFTIIERILLSLSILPESLLKRMMKPIFINPAFEVAKIANPQLIKTIDNNYDQIVEAGIMIDAKGSKDIFASLGKDPLEDHLHGPYPRSLILWAEEDKLILYKEVKALMERIGWPLVKIKGENHSLIIDDPELVSRIIYTYTFEGNIIESEKIEVERP